MSILVFKIAVSAFRVQRSDCETPIPCKGALLSFAKQLTCLPPFVLNELASTYNIRSPTFTSPLLFSLLSLSLPTSAKTVTYDWEITWVTASLDEYERPVIGINSQWPHPSTIEVDIGDRPVVQITKSLGNQSTSLHWHDLRGEERILRMGPLVPPNAPFTYKLVLRTILLYACSFTYHGVSTD